VVSLYTGNILSGVPMSTVQFATLMFGIGVIIGVLAVIAKNMKK